MEAVERSREQEMFALYDAHVNELYRYAYRRCRDHALAEDVTQETFVAVVRSDADPSTITIAFLKTVARNKLVDVLRREIRYEEKLRLIANSMDQSQVSDVIERLRIDDALESLPVHYRLVVTLHYLNGMTIPAIARDLGRSYKSVESLMTRARRALAAQLQDDEQEHDGGGSMS